MAVTLMKFDKDWTNPSDFPTHESQESKVREDMQYLFNSIRDQFNFFARNELDAKNISYSPSTSTGSISNVRDALYQIEADLIGITQGGVPDNSITSAKLKSDAGEEAVGTNNIQDGAVTTDKIADGSITADKLASGAGASILVPDDSITQEKLADNSVGSDQIINYNIGEAKMANSSVSTRTIQDGAVGTDQIADSAISTAKLDEKAVRQGNIADAAVGSGQLATNAVISSKIKDGAVTNAKLDTGAVSIDKCDSTVQKAHSIVSVTVPVSSWNSTSKQATVTVEGVTTDTNQFVWWTAGDSSFDVVADNKVRCLVNPTTANRVVLQCETVPESAIQLYFVIFD